MTRFELEPINDRIGAFVHVAAEDILNEGVPEQIMAALNKYNVLVFPEAHMTDEQFVGLSNHFGEQHSLAATQDNSETSKKGIYRIELDSEAKDKNQLDYIAGNDLWHMDGTVYNVPGKSTLLKCERPASEGGHTEFASLFAAYEALPEARKQEIEKLRVVHCMEAIGVQLYDEPTEDDFARWNALFPATEHPLVWHQQDGRTSMLIGGTAYDIVGMEHAEGRKFLDDLLAWSTQEQFTYLHKWKKGDMVMFNNPGLLHRSHPYNAASGRIMHRTTIKGTEEIEREKVAG
ncbi:MAG TPA: TauD/TfdA family dioxygenase [Sphingobium sp.]|uniref:TauD/TfdA dioxygenase family protein n=1 Tax=Sphingobium sp. TaxID=1912891 RepID=UPI002ED63076